MSRFVFFFKQNTAYEMRISDWSSDVCSSDLSVMNRLRHVAADRDRAAVAAQQAACTLGEARKEEGFAQAIGLYRRQGMAGFHPGFGAEIFQVDPHTVLPNHALYERRRRVASESLYHHVHGLKRGWQLGPVHDAHALYGLLSSLRVDRR